MSTNVAINRAAFTAAAGPGVGGPQTPLSSLACTYLEVLPTTSRRELSVHPPNAHWNIGGRLTSTRKLSFAIQRERERKLLFAPKRTTSYHRQRFEALQLVQAHTLLCESREPRSLPRLPFRGDIKPPPYRSRFRLVGSVQSLSRSFEQQPASIGQSATCLPP